MANGSMNIVEYCLRSRVLVWREETIVWASGDLSSVGSWAPSQYPKRRLFVRSRKVSKPRDWYFKLSYRFEIWQAHRQHCCRSACQISERSDNSKYKSRGFETLRDLTKRRLFGYWDGALYYSHEGNCISYQFKWKFCRSGFKPLAYFTMIHSYNCVDISDNFMQVYIKW